MPTFRRLNDPTKYYGLSWRGWTGSAIAAGALYGAVLISPLEVKTTITIAVFVLAFAATTLYALGGQALGIWRYLIAVGRWYVSHKHYVPPATGHPRSGGLILDLVPAALVD